MFGYYVNHGRSNKYGKYYIARMDKPMTYHYATLLDRLRNNGL